MTEWEAEMYGVKQMIHKFGNIPYDDIVGKFTLDSQHTVFPHIVSAETILF